MTTLKKLTLPQSVALVFAGLLAAGMLYGGSTGDYRLVDRAMAPGILGITFLLGISASRATKNGEKNGG